MKKTDNDYADFCEKGTLRVYYKTILDFLYDEVDYALLMTGNWGCGKTYFCKNSLTQYLRVKGFNVVIVSLFGKTSIDEINWELYYKHKMRGKTPPKKSRVVEPLLETKSDSNNTSISVIQNLVKIAVGFSKDLISEEVSSEVFFRNKLFVFDDLERCDSAIRENLLGIIYTQFIANGAHVLFVADESKIDNPKLYHEKKEKLIRSTINFNFPHLMDALKSIMEKNNDKPVSQLYNLESKAFEAFVSDVNAISNLRTWTAAFETYNRIAIRCGIKPSEPYQLQLFGIVLLTTHYYKTEVSLFDTPEITFDQNEKTLEKEIKTSFGIDSVSSIMFGRDFRLLSNTPEVVKFARLKTLIVYLKTGYMNEEKFLNEFEDYYPSSNDAEKALIRTYDYKSLSEEEFRDCLEKILVGVEEHAFGFEKAIGIGNWFSRFDSMGYLNLYCEMFKDYKQRIITALLLYSDNEVASFFQRNPVVGCPYEHYLKNTNSSFMDDALKKIASKFDAEQRLADTFAESFKTIGDFTYLSNVNYQVKEKMIEKASKYGLFPLVLSYRCIDVSIISAYVYEISTASNCGDIPSFYSEIPYLRELRDFITDAENAGKLAGKLQIELLRLADELDSAANKLETTKTEK